MPHFPLCFAVRGGASGAPASAAAGSGSGSRQGAPVTAVHRASVCCCRWLPPGQGCIRGRPGASLVFWFWLRFWSPSGSCQCCWFLHSLPAGARQEANRRSAHRPAAVSRCFAAHPPAHSRAAFGAAAAGAGSQSKAVTAAAAGEQEGMVEVEVKLRLPDAAAHASLAQALQGGYKATYQQVGAW